MPELDLDELERQAKAATSGPWEVVDARAFLDDEDFEIRNGGHCIGYGTSEKDAAYIVAACNAVPELIKRVRELERQREEFAKYMETMCRYCDRDGFCPIFNYCPAPNLLKSCGDMKKADWIQAAKEANDA